MVGAMDDELHEYMKSLGVATWPMGSVGIGKDAVKKDFGWGSQNFHKMGRDKIRLIRDFTKVEGISVLISDIDVAWLRDPTPFFARYPSADILVSTDLLRSEINLEPNKQSPHLSPDGEGLEFHICHAASNIGIMWFRSTRGSQQLTQEWVKRIEADDKLWDQNAFNDLKALAGACQYVPDGQVSRIPPTEAESRWACCPSRSSATATRSTRNGCTLQMGWRRTRCITRFSSGVRLVSGTGRGEFLII